MAKRDELLALEKGFWTGDSAYFKENTDAACLVAFPDMAEVLGRADLAKTAENPHRWQNLEIHLKGLLEPTDSQAFLTYEAHAVRENGEAYRALVSTAYVKRNDGWKMVFHSQAPLEGK
jgi:hypothetical protein